MKEQEELEKTAIVIDDPQSEINKEKAEQHLKAVLAKALSEQIRNSKDFQNFKRNESIKGTKAFTPKVWKKKKAKNKMAKQSRKANR